MGTPATVVNCVAPEFGTGMCSRIRSSIVVLTPGSPAINSRPAWVGDWIGVEAPRPTNGRRWNAPKKNIRSRRIGPPSVNPYVSRRSLPGFSKLAAFSRFVRAFSDSPSS